VTALVGVQNLWHKQPFILNCLCHFQICTTDGAFLWYSRTNPPCVFLFDYVRAYCKCNTQNRSNEVNSIQYQKKCAKHTTLKFELFLPKLLKLDCLLCCATLIVFIFLGTNIRTRLKNGIFTAFTRGLHYANSAFATTVFNTIYCVHATQAYVLTALHWKGMFL